MSENTRIKRGMIDLGSRVQKWIFGTVDAEDGEYSENAFKNF